MPQLADRLENIPAAMRAPVQDYCTLLRELGGANVRSLTIFGPIVAGRFDATRHSIQSVMVVGEIDLDMLRRLSQHGLDLGKRRIAAPLVMTNAYIIDSCDTFPLEFIEIQQAHATIFGDDAFESLQFEPNDVRLQCEREFKSILIGMRQGLLATAGKDKALEAIELSGADTLLRTLRGMLWIKSRNEALPADVVVAEIEKLTGRSLPGVRAVIDPSGPHGWEQFRILYHDVQSLAGVVDAW